MRLPLLKLVDRHDLTPWFRPSLRKLDDEELDSGDDEDRNDRLADEEDGAMDMGGEGHSANIMDVKLGRHAVPDPGDGEVCGQRCDHWQSSDDSDRHIL